MELDLKIGVRQKVYATYLQPNNSFFLQQDTDEAYELPDLSQKIQAEVDSGALAVISSPAVGKNCCALSGDGVWYRAVVTNCSGPVVTAYYVDYGNSEQVQVKNLVETSSALLTTPYQAIQCVLSDFIATSLAETLNAALQEMIVGQEFHAVIQSKSSNSSLSVLNSIPCYNVTLFESQDSTTSLSSQLVKANLGHFHICNSNVVIGKKYNAYTSFDDSPGKFWVQMSDQAEQLQEVMDSLNAPDTLSSLKPMPPSGISAGVASACCYDEDGRYYRAEIISIIRSEKKVNICFVDYGNCSTVAAADVMQLPASLAVSPLFAVQCCLEGIKPIKPAKPDPKLGNIAWNKQACQKFNQLTQDLEFEVHIVSEVFPDIFGVHLTDVNNSQDIGKVLCSSKNAEIAVSKSGVPSQGGGASKVEGYSYIELELNKPYNNLFISYAESPAKVWCQPASEPSKFESLVEELASEAPSLPLLSDCKVTSPCCVLYTADESWCRGCVQSIDASKQTAQVLFVDYGNVESFQLADIKTLPSKYLSLPAQTVSFSVVGISPRDGENWSREAIECFQGLVMERAVNCKIVGLDPDGYPAAKMSDPLNGNKDISLELVNRGHAKVPLTASPQSQVYGGRSDITSPARSLKERSYHESPRAAPSPSSPKRPYRDSTKVAASPSSSTRRSSRSRDSSQSSFHSRSSDTYSPSHSAKFSRIKLQPGQAVDAMVIHVESLTEFYVQLKSSYRDLEELMAQMNTYCNSSEAKKVRSVHQGQPLLARFSEDGGWYRAMVESVPSKKSSCMIDFVDYGNGERVALSDLVYMPSQFLKLPIQAIRCCLNEVSVDKEMPESAINAFGHLCIEREFQMQVQHCTRHKDNDVFMVDLKAPTGESVFEHLIKKKKLPGSLLEVQDANVPFPQLPLKQPVDVIMSYHETPAKFVLQLSHTYQDLEALSNALNSHYGKLKTGQESLVGVQVGSFCAVQFSEDGLWYRGRVTSVRASKAQVMYIDFGNSEELDVSSLKTLKPEFSKIACMGVPCSLAGVREPDECSGKSLSRFFEFVSKKLVGEFKKPYSSFDELVPVALTDTSNSDRDVSVLDSIRSAAKLSKSNQLVISDITPVSNSPMESSVVFVVSPGELYCQLDSEKSIFDNLMNKMYGFYGEGKEGTPVLSPTVGSYCASLYSDGSWYRGRITAISPQGITVFYLDYGNTESVESSSLRALEPQFCTVPIQALKCFLSGLQPPSSGWSKKCISRIQNLLMEKSITAIYSGVQDSRGHAVQLIVEGEDLAVLLQREGLATATSTSSPRKPLVTSKSLSIRPYPLVKGSDYRVLVTCVLSPLEVFAQILNPDEKLDLLMQEIASYCKTAASGGSDWKPGDCILAQFTQDEMWYRGVITNTTKGKSEFEVFYHDYGNSETLSASRFLQIQPQFCELPAQAVKCRVEGAQYYKYTQQATQQFNELLSDQEFLIKCLSVSEDNTCAADFKRCDDGVDVMSLAISESIAAAKISAVSVNSPDNLLCTHIFPSEITPDSFHDVMVVYAESPDNFFCQFSLSSIEALNKMMAELEEYYSSATSGARPLTDQKIGDYVVAQFSEDGQWYRAVITDIKPDTVSVIFVDYGNSDKVQPSNLRKIAPQFTRLSAQAVPCRLAEVRPVDHVQWSEQAITEFSNLTLERSCIAQVKGSKDLSGHLFKFGDGQQLEIALIDSETSNNSVDELVHLGLAVATTSPVDASACDDQAASLPASQFTRPTLNPKQVYEAYVSYVESPSRFWLQLASSEETLATIQEKLSSFYPGKSNQVVNPLPNMACCSKFSQDEGWYRSTIQAKHPEGVSVLFVDYGNSEMVSLSDVCAIKPEFLAWDTQAFCCSLHGCQPTEGDSGWSENAVGVFNELVVDKDTPFKVSIVSVAGEGECFSVSLKDGESDVCSQLIQCGVASRKVTPSKEAVAAPTIPQVKLSEGQEYLVYIAYIDTPAKFYCQLSSDLDKLESLMAEISDFYNGNNLEPLIEEGAYCVAQYSKNLAWYRARILSITPDGVLIHFIDYGNSEVVSAEHILALASQFATLPSQAIVCSIVEDDTQHFPEDVLERFIDLDLEQDFTISITSRTTSGEYYIKLFDQEGDLVNESLFNAPPIAAPPAASPVVPLPPPPSASPVIKSYTSLQYNIGASVDVYVSHTDSPTSFFCQPLELSGELDDMMTDIGVYMSSESHQPLPVDSLQSGMVCLGLYARDSGWYRAVIEEVFSGSNALVNFVDYGNKETVALEHLSVLPPQFAKPPLQAFHCSVFSSISSDTTWNVEQAEQFRNLVPESEQFTVEVKDFVPSKNQHLVLISSNGEPIDLAPLLGQKIEPSAGSGFLGNRSLLQMRVESSNVSMIAMKGSKTPSKGSGSDNGETETTDDESEGKPLIQAPFKLSLVAQEVLEASVVFIESPSLIYIQRADCKTEVDALAEEIAQYCASHEEEGLHARLSFCEGDFVLAKWFEDEHWYRGEVIGVDSASTDSACKVSFIDYGNTEVISFNSLVMCPKKFLELPAQAIPCSLAQVPHRDSWPLLYRDLIADVVEDKVLVVTVVLPGGQGMTPTVRLEEVESREDVSQAVLAKLQEECEGGTSEIIEEEEEEENREDVSQAVLEEVGEEASPTVPNGEIEGVSGEATGEAETSEILSTREAEEEEERIEKPFSRELPQRVISPGSLLEVSVMSCLSPSSLLCQLPAEAEALDEITIKLNELYGERTYSPISPSSLVEGLYVAALFSDQQWYRAKVMCCGDDNTYEVVYIDFGNTESIPLESIRPLDESLALHPPLVLECSLSGILPLSGGDDYPPSAAEKVLELVGEEVCTMEVTAVEDPSHFSVVLTSAQGVSIAAALVECELAMPLNSNQEEEVNEELKNASYEEEIDEAIPPSSHIQPTENAVSSQVRAVSPKPLGVSSEYPVELTEKKDEITIPSDHLPIADLPASDGVHLSASAGDLPTDLSASAGDLPTDLSASDDVHPTYPSPSNGVQSDLPTDLSASAGDLPTDLSASDDVHPTDLSPSNGVQSDLPTDLSASTGIQSDLSASTDVPLSTQSTDHPDLQPTDSSIPTSVVTVISPSTPLTSPPATPDVPSSPLSSSTSHAANLLPSTPPSTPPSSRGPSPGPSSGLSTVPPFTCEAGEAPTLPLSSPEPSFRPTHEATSPATPSVSGLTPADLPTSAGDVPPGFSAISTDISAPDDVSSPLPIKTSGNTSSYVVASEYPVSSLVAGSQHSVKVVSVTSPENFTCQLTHHQNELEALLEAIASRDYKKDEQDELWCSQLKVALPVCACGSKSDVWYRGLIMTVAGDLSSCTVLDVDTGAVETLSRGRIKHMEKSFADTLPPQNIRCSFPVLLENDLNPSLPSTFDAWELSWPTSCTQHFRNMVSAATGLFSLEILAASKDGTHVVRLYNEQFDIRDSLVGKIRDPGECVIRESVPEENGFSEETEQISEEDSGDVSGVQAPLNEISHTEEADGFGDTDDAQASCRDAAGGVDGVNASINADAEGHEDDSNGGRDGRNEAVDGATEDSVTEGLNETVCDGTESCVTAEKTTTDFTEYPGVEYSVGEELNLVYISSSSPNSITCQLKDDAPQLEALMKEILEFASSNDSPSPSSFNVGGPHLAKFSEDQLWYRAEVLSHSDPDNVEVLFIDYGNSEVVPVSSTMSMPSQFLTLRRQVVTFRLATKSGVTVDQWPDHASNKLVELFQDCLSLIGTVVDPNGDCIAVALKSDDCQDFAESIQ